MQRISFTNLGWNASLNHLVCKVNGQWTMVYCRNPSDPCSLLWVNVGGQRFQL